MFESRRQRARKAGQSKIYFRYSTCAEFIDGHKSRVNDMIFRANRCTMHYAFGDYDISVAGDVPAAY